MNSDSILVIVTLFEQDIQHALSEDIMWYNDNYIYITIQRVNWVGDSLENKIFKAHTTFDQKRCSWCAYMQVWKCT